MEEKSSGSGVSMRQKLRQAHQVAQKFTAPKAKAAGRALSSTGSEPTSESAGSSFDADDSGRAEPSSHTGFMHEGGNCLLTHHPLRIAGDTHGGFTKAMRRVHFDESGGGSSGFEDGLLLPKKKRKQKYKRTNFQPKLAPLGEEDWLVDNIASITLALTYGAVVVTVLNSSYAHMLHDVALPLTLLMAIPVGVLIFLYVVRSVYDNLG